MKILLVNNNTLHLQKIVQSLAGHEVEIQNYHPNIAFHQKDKDLIILSGGGGEGREIHDESAPNKLWYGRQIELILSSNKPIIGICMGFHLIGVAYGAKIEKLPGKIEQFITINTTLKGRRLLKTKEIWQFEGHEWCIKTVPKEHFDTLAKSKTGIEIIRHKTRPVVATQFHPEVPGSSIELANLVKNHQLFTR